MSPLESKLRHMALGAGPTIECTQAADRIAALQAELDELKAENKRLREVQAVTCCACGQLNQHIPLLEEDK